MNIIEFATASKRPISGEVGYWFGTFYSYGGYDTTTTQYTEGTLNIDLIDSASATLIWEGVTVGRITDKVRENLEEAVNSAIPEIMASYTQVASGFVPPQPVEAAK